MTEKEFSQALRRGLGGAIIELKNNENKSAYRDIVLRCCLHDISYDWQVEGTKGYYLYSAISTFADRAYFERAIIEKFIPRCEDRLFRQLAKILFYCAKDGSTLAKDALYAKHEYFSTKKGRFTDGRIDEVSQWEDVVISLFAVDGFSAFKRHAVDVGELLSRNPNSSYCDWFITVAEDTFSKKRIRVFLDKMYEKSDAIKVLVDTIKVDELSRKQYQANHKEERITVEAIVRAAKELASSEISHYGPVMRLRHPFLKNASDAEILELAHIVLREEDETVKGLLLRIFLSNKAWNKPFPLGVVPLLEYAQSNNKILYENALPVLLHVYQRGDCSHCRYNIVKAMHHCKVLTDEILAECLYDSYEDTREFAKRLTEKQKRMEVCLDG
jgi:hypothetical protein